MNAEVSLFFTLSKEFIVSNPHIWILCAISFAISAISIFFVIKICNKFGWYDSTNERKVHKGNIPRLGSIGFVGAYVIVSIIYLVMQKEARTSQIPIIAAGFLIFIFGILDDFLELKAIFKLIVQIISALIIVLNGYVFTSIGNLVFPIWFRYVLTFGWILGIINAFNLIDGIDGLCGGLSTLIMITLSVIYMRATTHPAANCLFLAFALMGFLVYNKPKAKIFMGDGGSQFLGFMMAVLPLYQTTENFEYNKFLIMLNLVSIPMLDTIAAIWRRKREHRGIMTPDKQHLHHKLMQLGLSTTQILNVLLSLQFIICLVCGIAMYMKGFEAFILLLSLYIVIILLFCTVHFLYKRSLTSQVN